MNNQAKLKLVVLMGGRSAEHEISLLSAASVMVALDKQRYEVYPVGIDKQGKWWLYQDIDCLDNAADPKSISLKDTGQAVLIAPGGIFFSLSQGQKLMQAQAIFSLVHGTFGEDGTLQGLFKIMDVPFVGPSVLGSAIAMDKDIAKKLLTQAGLPNAKFLTYHKTESDIINYSEVSQALGEVLFVKPANLGSSVGISKVKDENGFKAAVAEAFKFDDKILVEEFIAGQEIECSVLGNTAVKASLPGRVIPRHDFYSYDSKYIDEQGADFEIPARLPDATVQEIKMLAVKAFKVLQCEGMARVDFFLRADGKLFINEINTIPGFVKISMYPKLWEASGLPYSQLLDELIALAIERWQRESRLQTSYH